MIRLSFFVWLMVPALLWGGYKAYGLPHVIWSYDWRGSSSDWSRRSYSRCSFVGPYGIFTTHPSDRRCPWLAFYKRKEAGQ